MAPLQSSELAAMQQATAVAVAVLLLPRCSAFCPRWSLAPGGHYAPKISRIVFCICPSAYFKLSSL